MVADSHSIFARWSNHFSHVLDVHRVNDVRRTEIHTAEPLVPEPIAFEVELAIEKLKSHKSTVIDQIAAELIKAGGRTIHSDCSNYGGISTLPTTYKILSNILLSR